MSTEENPKDTPTGEETLSCENAPQEAPSERTAAPTSTPLYVRVLALLGALVFLGLTIAYAYSIATGGIFWM